MATYVNVTVGGGDLLARDRAQRDASRFAKLESDAQQELKGEKDKQAREPQGRSLQPLPRRRRDPAASGGGGFWFYARNWVSRVHRVWVTPPAIATSNLDYYDVHDASVARHFLVDYRNPGRKRELYASTVPEHLFKYGGAWNVEAGRPFMNIGSGGPRDYIEPPVYSCANGVIYGMQRHLECWTETPLTSDVTGDPICTWDCRHTYVFFRFNAKKGNGLTYRVVTEHSRSVGITGWGPYYADLQPWYRGGSEWRRVYRDNAFPGDPSKDLRAQGYVGQYQVDGNRAYFLRVCDVRNRDEMFTAYEMHREPTDLDLDYFYYKSNGSNTGPGKTAWDYWRKLEVLTFDVPADVAGWTALSNSFNIESPPQPVLQRAALDKTLYDPTVAIPAPIAGIAQGKWAALRKPDFDMATDQIYRSMYDYTNPPSDLVTAPHNPPTSYTANQDRWWEAKLHPLIALV